jgi:hypothetical protein
VGRAIESPTGLFVAERMRSVEIGCLLRSTLPQALLAGTPAVKEIECA